MTATPTMEQLGHEIKVVLGKSENMRLTAACKLAEARKRFDAGERCDRKSWKDWIEKYAGLSEDNAKVLLRIGRADDPEQQLALENDRAAKGMKKTRARATAMQVEIYAKWIADASRNADSSDAKMLKNTSNSISVRPSRRRHEGAARCRHARIHNSHPCEAARYGSKASTSSSIDGTDARVLGRRRWAMRATRHAVAIDTGCL